MGKYKPGIDTKRVRSRDRRVPCQETTIETRNGLGRSKMRTTFFDASENEGGLELRGTHLRTPKCQGPGH